MCVCVCDKPTSILKSPTTIKGLKEDDGERKLAESKSTEREENLLYLKKVHSLSLSTALEIVFKGQIFLL